MGSFYIESEPGQSVRINLAWRGDRVVEGSSLENCRTGNGTEGSNPSLSAKLCRI
jgi:hypothetical protein